MEYDRSGRNPDGQGSGIACERIQGVNDNMSQSHYHEYYEIYYLEAGERFHMVEDKLYKMEAGEFIIFLLM